MASEPIHVAAPEDFHPFHDTVLEAVYDRTAGRHGGVTRSVLLGFRGTVKEVPVTGDFRESDCKDLVGLHYGAALRFIGKVEYRSYRRSLRSCTCTYRR